MVYLYHLPNPLVFSYEWNSCVLAKLLKLLIISFNFVSFLDGQSALSSSQVASTIWYKWYKDCSKRKIFYVQATVCTRRVSSVDKWYQCRLALWGYIILSVFFYQECTCGWIWLEKLWYDRLEYSRREISVCWRNRNTSSAEKGDWNSSKTRLLRPGNRENP